MTDRVSYKRRVPRRRDPARFPALVDHATDTFITGGGFRRTQIDDVARAMGVAKGTVYLYVASKEALFDVVVRSADRGPAVEPADLPVPTPRAGATVAYLRERLAADASFERLTRAERAARPDDAATEVAEVVGEIYDTLARNRTTIKLIGTSALDVPELAELWYGRARGVLVERVERWVRRRARQEAIRTVADPAAAARLIVETCSWFAVHRHWDPQPQEMDDDRARETVRAILCRGLVVDS